MVPDKAKDLSARDWATRGGSDIENFLTRWIQIEVDYHSHYFLGKNAILFFQDQQFEAQSDTILLILNFRAIDFLKVMDARTSTKPKEMCACRL